MARTPKETEAKEPEFTVVSEVSCLDQNGLTRLTQTLKNPAEEVITRVFVDGVEQTNDQPQE